MYVTSPVTLDDIWEHISQIVDVGFCFVSAITNFNPLSDFHIFRVSQLGLRVR
jgi:hypothetical protein